MEVKKIKNDISGKNTYAIYIKGIVQGVGFRPFIWRLATESGFAGIVCWRVVEERSHGGEAEGQPTVEL